MYSTQGEQGLIGLLMTVNKVAQAIVFIMIPLLMPVVVVAEKLAAKAATPQECVVLLHGLFRTQLSMKAVQWKLEEEGFEVVSQTYPSLTHSIEELAIMAVESGVRACRARGLEHIHFVTHSLGGILIRQYMVAGGIEGLQRVVMLGPPNQGSQLADFVSAQKILHPFTAQAIVQLGTGEQSIPRHLGPASFKLGIIAGTANRRGALPGFPQEASDGTVAVAETVVPGMLDFLEMPVSHSFMMWDNAVLRQTVYFLNHGSFDRGAKP